MRSIVVAVVLCVAGCAGQPATKQARVSDQPKASYKVVMKGDKKLYCTQELETGSHVNYRTVCLTPEEYAQMEEQTRSEWMNQTNRGVTPRNGPSGIVAPGGR